MTKYMYQQSMWICLIKIYMKMAVTLLSKFVLHFSKENNHLNLTKLKSQFQKFMFEAENTNFSLINADLSNMKVFEFFQ